MFVVWVSTPGPEDLMPKISPTVDSRTIAADEIGCLDSFATARIEIDNLGNDATIVLRKVDEFVAVAKLGARKRFHPCAQDRVEHVLRTALCSLWTLWGRLRFVAGRERLAAELIPHQARDVDVVLLPVAIVRTRLDL